MGVKGAGTVAGILGNGMLAWYEISALQKGVEETPANASPLEYAKNIAGEATGVNPLYEQVTAPDYAQQLYEKPVTTTVSTILNTLPVLGLGAAAYRGIRGGMDTLAGRTVVTENVAPKEETTPIAEKPITDIQPQQDVKPDSITTIDKPTQVPDVKEWTGDPALLLEDNSGKFIALTDADKVEAAKINGQDVPSVTITTPTRQEWDRLTSPEQDGWLHLASATSDEDRLSALKELHDNKQVSSEALRLANAGTKGEDIVSLQPFIAEGDAYKPNVDVINRVVESNKDVFPQDETPKSSNIITRFISEDVKPSAQNAIDVMKAGAKDVQTLLAPQTMTEESKLTASVWREKMAELQQKMDRAEYSLRSAREYFSKQNNDDNLKFINGIEKGEKQSTPQLQEFADGLRKVLDNAKEDVQKLGTGKLSKVIENYFPHIWKDPEKAQSFFMSWNSKRPLEGAKSFLKQRMIPTTEDGIKAGLEPVSYNPVDLTLLKIKEMEKYVMAQSGMDEFGKLGLRRFVRDVSGEKVPDNWAKIDDRISTVYGPPVVKVKDFYDPALQNALEHTAEKLGVEYHKNADNKIFSDIYKKYNQKPKNISGILGISVENTTDGINQIYTRFGAPEDVLAHEIGHQLDNKFHLMSKWKGDKSTITNTDGTTTTVGDTISKELNAIAMQRLNSDSPRDRINYVLSYSEPMAAVVQSYVHAPELLKEVAPTTYKYFVDFLSQHPELKELQDIKPSLLRQENVAEQHINGLPVMGHYYMPSECAKIINNYLSPGLRGSAIYRTWNGISNLMNQSQLGFSAFHLGFTSMDSIVSKVALAEIKATRGDFLEAAKDILHAPISPLENAMRGDKLYKEWMNPGSTDLATAQLVDALKSGGGRIKMDEMYRTNALQTMKDAYNQGNIIGAGLRLPFAVIEAQAKPILEYVVPRQKLGVFADLMKYELEKDPGMTHQQLRFTAAKIWNSVDNRLGQLCYDNLFWNKTLKDCLMASTRSVGWNLGTFRELGGAGVDTAEQALKLLSGKKPELTYKMSYATALPLVVGIAGAIMQYLYTGQAPQDMKDLFFPRTGTLDQNGRPQRIELPSYMKDVYAYKERPVTTLENKAHPMLSFMADLFRNRDFYGTEIVHPDDTFLKNGEDLASFAGKNIMPFSIQNINQKANLGGPVLSKVLPFVGVTPAPRSINETDLEKRISDILISKMPTGTRTKEQFEHSKLKSSIIRDMQVNGGRVTDSFTQAVKNKDITSKEAKTIQNEAKLTPLQRGLSHLSPEEINGLKKYATPEEMPIVDKILQKKIANKRK